MKPVRNPIVLLEYANRQLAKPHEPIADEKNGDMLIRSRDGVVNNSIYETFRGRLLKDGYITNIDQEEQIQNQIFGIEIDLNNEDPYTNAQYIGTSENFVPITFNMDGSANMGSWGKWIEPFFGIKPCLLKDGEVLHYLRPDDYNYSDDEVPIDIRYGVKGDVTIEFAKLYYKIEITDDNILTFKISNFRPNNTFTQDAFCEENGGGAIKNYMYISAYDNIKRGNQAISLSDRLPEEFDRSNWTLKDIRNMCKAKGKGYQQIGYAKALYLICLEMLFLKTVNIPSITGYIEPIADELPNTGSFNVGGLFQISDVGYKFMGIENLFIRNTFLEGIRYEINGDEGVCWYRAAADYEEDIRNCARFNHNPLGHGVIKFFKSYENRVLFPSDIGGSIEEYTGIMNHISGDSGVLYPIFRSNLLTLKGNLEESYANPRFVYC